MKPVPAHLLTKKNQQVLDYLKDKSCHGDIVEPLVRILKNYPQVQSFCPDPAHFRYCLWYVDDQIVAFAIGMQSVSLWAPDWRAGVFGTTSKPEAGPDWYSIDWNHPYLEQLVKASLAALA